MSIIRIIRCMSMMALIRFLRFITYDGTVGLDGAKWIIRRLRHLCTRETIEKSGFANIREPDNSATLVTSTEAQYGGHRGRPAEKGCALNTPHLRRSS
jgi:hypothetical protein